MINLPKPSALQNGIDANGKITYILSYLSRLVKALEQELIGYNKEETSRRANSVADVNYDKDGNLSFTFDDGTQKILEISSTNSKVLWSGGHFMNASQHIDFDENVDEQTNGIVLVFSAYANGQAQDYDFCEFFIPKKMVELKNGNGHTFTLTNNAFTKVANKYLYIGNTGITGVDSNEVSSTASGITFNNKYWVLRYVIGV